MFSLVYASSAVAEFSPSELVHLLRACHRNNTKLGVTGMLLYKDGNFMQAIEGEEDVVRDLHAKIALDPRHRGMMTLLEGSVPERQFPDFSMGFRDLNAPEARSIPGYSQFLNIPLTDTVFSSDPAQCQKLLTTFRRTM